MSRGSWRTTPLPSGWGRLRASVLMRDPICRWGMLPGEDGPCHMPSTTSDHIGPPDDHRIELMRGLCDPHHKRRSGQQGAVARTARYRAMKYRPREPHPGFIRDGG
jgi:5-methylcytosine-specific restriction enzyme A